MFEDTPFAETIPRLSRWYDLDLRLGDDRIGRRYLTVQFTNQSVEVALEAIALSLEAHYTRNGRVVTFYVLSGPIPR